MSDISPSSAAAESMYFQLQHSKGMKISFGSLMQDWKVAISLMILPLHWDMLLKLDDRTFTSARLASYHKFDVYCLYV